MTSSTVTCRITNWIASLVALTIVIVLPLSYFATAYQYMVGSLETEAEINSRIVSELINSNPEMWRYEELRFQEILSRRPKGEVAETRRILDRHGMEIASSRNELPRPVISRSHELLDAGVEVGRIEISRSLQKLILNSAVAGMAGLLLALIVFIPLRLLPLRAIRDAEAKLLEKHQLLSMIMESTTNAIFAIDQTGRIIMANRRVAELSGYLLADLQSMYYERLFTPTGVAEVASKMATISADGEDTVRFESELISRDGQIVPIDCGLACLTIGQNFTGVVISAEDITERNLAEETLYRYAQELQENNEELQSLVYIASHNLRTPLVSVKGFCSELRQSVQSLTGKITPLITQLTYNEQTACSEIMANDIPEALRYIDTAVTTMNNQINGLLNLSQLNQRELVPEIIDLNVIVTKIISACSSKRDNKVEFVTQPLPELLANRTAIELILANLIDNAVKYLDPARPGRIEISASCDNAAEVTLHVSDNGRGISAADLPRVFEMFKRVGAQDVPGQGMGLAYVKSMVRRMGGQISCDSQFGAGTRFSMTIPNQKMRKAA